MKILLFIPFLFLNTFKSNAQDNIVTDSTITTCLHVIFDNGSSAWAPPIAYILRNIDTLGNVSWQSTELKDFIKDSGNLAFVKADIPMHVLNNSKEVWCTAIGRFSNGDTIRMNYGGVVFSKIKLLLKSTPEGAETYLIPNRIWMQNFENAELEKMYPQLQKFRINTSNTDTYSYIDETVFMVVYKMNGKYKTAIHYTKPYSIEQEQTVWVNFQ